MNLSRAYFGWLLALALVSQGGCSWWAQAQTPVPDVKPLRKARSAELVKQYEQYRDQAQYDAAASAWDQGSTESCRELLDKLLERSPKHVCARLLSIQLRLLEQELAAAQAEADSLAHDVPGNAEVLHVQGLAYQAAGESASAAECYRRALEIDPQNETYAASLENVDETGARQPVDHPMMATVDNCRASAALLRAEMHLALGEVEAARHLAEAAGTQTPARAESESLLARICEADGNAREADEHRQRAAQLQSVQKVRPVGYDASSQPSRRVRDDEASISADKQLDDALAAESPTPVLRVIPSVQSPSSTSPGKSASAEESLRRGEAALAVGTPTAARRFFQQALTADCNDDHVALAAAVATLRHDHPEMAAELAQTALRQWPKSAALYRVWGMAEYRRGNCAAAQVALRQALSLDNSHALAYFLMGCTLSKLGQDEEAARNFRQAQQLDTRYALEH